MPLLPLIVGCSALRLGYNQAPTLAYWWLDGYVDFDDSQAPKVKAALAQWFAWHRASQLRDYADALADLRATAAGPVSAPQLCGQWRGWQKRLELAFEQVVPAAADLLPSLTPAQLRHIEQQQAKKQAQAETDQWQDDAASRRKAREKRSVERAESLYGNLTPAQRDLLVQDIAQSPYQPERWLVERKLRHQALIEQVRQWQAERADPATLQAGVRRLGSSLLVSPRPAYQAYADRVTLHNCALGAAVHNAAGAEQRQHLQAKLQAWEDDLRALAGR